MRQITININPSIYEHIMFFLRNLPSKLVDIEFEKKINTHSIANVSNSNMEAFGILKGRIKDPVAWQREIREESDRDIYR